MGIEASLHVDADGLLVGAEYIASPNYDDRPPCPINLLVIHNISLPPGEFGGAGVSQLFTNSLKAADHPYYASIDGLKVSSHFFVRRDGHIQQFVPCSKRAWHAGESCWQGMTRCNDFSIGIELEGADNVPYTDSQYEALVRLTLALRKTYMLRGIAGHKDIAPQRKTDPGESFDWKRYLSLLQRQ